MNKSNFDTSNNLHSFSYAHYNHVLPIGIWDIDALDLQEKHFFPRFSLQPLFIDEMSQTRILITIYILFVISTTIMLSPLGYTI